MRHSLNLAMALAVLMICVLPTRAADELEGPMKRMEKDFKALKVQVKDKTLNESSLKLLADMERNVIAAKVVIPVILTWRTSIGEIMTWWWLTRAITFATTPLANGMRTAISSARAAMNA